MINAHSQHLHNLSSDSKVLYTMTLLVLGVDCHSVVCVYVPDVVLWVAGEQAIA